MQTNVAQLLKAPVGSIRTLPINDVLTENGVEYRVRGDVTLVRSKYQHLGAGQAGNPN